MILLSTVPFVLAVGLYWTSPVIARRLPPAPATWVLTVLSLTVSLTCGLVLSAAAVVSLGRLPLAGSLGHWSASELGHDGAPPVWVGLTIAVTVTVLLASALLRGGRTIRAMVDVHSAIRGLETPASNLVVLDHAVPTAYAIGGWPGRIVVSTSMMAALPADERRVLLAHEAAHIRCHHHLFVQACEIAAAANPLARPALMAVRTSTERWADEVAAREVGDRRLTARSLARAALAGAHASHGGRAPYGALGSSGGDIVHRVDALMTEPTAHRWPLSAGLLIGATAGWLAAGAVAMKAHDLMELAQSAYHH